MVTGARCALLSYRQGVFQMAEFKIINSGDIKVFAGALKEFYGNNGAEKFIARYEKEPKIRSITKILYLVAMIEYLCKVNNLDKPEWISKYAGEKSSGVIVMDDNMDLLTQCCMGIKEFSDRNIIETSIV